ncbi:TPA: hypothetical protein SL372_003081 [Pseudomonas aeruginosa]|nr:hypothetical protein [Pseudomonas aeruginosa]
MTQNNPGNQVKLKDLQLLVHGVRRHGKVRLDQLLGLSLPQLALFGYSLLPLTEN